MHDTGAAAVSTAKCVRRWHGRRVIEPPGQRAAKRLNGGTAIFERLCCADVATQRLTRRAEGAAADIIAVDNGDCEHER